MPRLLTVCLLCLLAWLQYRVWLGTGSVREYRELQSQIQTQQTRNATLSARNARLAAEIEDLKHNLAAVEARARQELGMIKPGETFYQIIE